MCVCSVQECHPASELTWDAIARTHLYRATLVQNNTDADAVEKGKSNYNSASDYLKQAGTNVAIYYLFY